MSEDVIDTRPRPGNALLVGAVAIVGAVALVASSSALALGVLGTLLLAAGTAAGSSRAVSIGALAALGGVAVGATAGVGELFVVFATASALVAWDAALQALDLGETVGREADSRRALSVHVAVAGGVACVAGGVGYALYLVVGGGRPVGALVLLLVGGVLLATTLR